jgi:hypothetical protein
MKLSMQTLPLRHTLRDHAASFYCGANAAAATVTAMSLLPDNIAVKAIGGGVTWVYSYAMTGSLMADITKLQANCSTQAAKLGAVASLALLYSAAVMDEKIEAPLPAFEATVAHFTQP